MPIRVLVLPAILIGLLLSTASAADAPRQISESGITHSFLALGADTYIMGADGKVTRAYPNNTRDGWVLPGGNLLLAVTRGAEGFPHGGAVELTPEGKTVWEFKGTQDEVNTVERIAEDRYMLTEAGDKPRIIEVDRDGKIAVDVPIQAQIRDHHLQTRMTRKLPNGNYLVPQLLDKVVREYTPEGKIVWEARTPENPGECWPFTAIRLPDGNTLVTCTHGLRVVEFDKDARIVWQLSNDDLPEPLLADPCGAQRLPNGNTVITSYGQNKPGAVKLLEVTREKKVVWTYSDEKVHGIHEFQILDTSGKPLEGPPMK